MPERIRSIISSVAVRPGETPPELYVGGDYGEEIDTGAYASAGAGAGAEFTGDMIAEDPRALILVPIVLPFAMITGAIAGAAGAKIEQQIRRYRDGLTNEMLDESNPVLPSVVLAADLERFIDAVQDIEVVDSDEADATLTITLTEIAVELDGKEAEMSATAHLTVKMSGDNQALYARSVTYRDRDTLRNWARHDNALWKEFTVNARRYLAREAAAQLFETITTRHVLRPTRNDSYRMKTAGPAWSGDVRTDTPTLSWDFVLLGGDDFDGTDIAETPARFDLEIYDGSRLVYAAEDHEGNRHEVAEPLPRCKRLRWSVRPILRVDGKQRAGEWMWRASAAERAYGYQGATFGDGTREYLDGFAELKTRCTQ